MSEPHTFSSFRTLRSKQKQKKESFSANEINLDRFRLYHCRTVTMVSSKKSPAKAGRTAIDDHHRVETDFDTPKNKTPTGRGSSHAADETLTSTPTGKSGRRGRGTPKVWNFTHVPPNQEDRAKNGRQEGRNLITWTRRFIFLADLFYWLETLADASVFRSSYVREAPHAPAV